MGAETLVLGALIADDKAKVQCIEATIQLPYEYSCDLNKMSPGKCVGECPIKDVPDLEKCQAACSKVAGCRAITFNRYGSCYLKSELGALQDDLPEHQTVSCSRK